jgi:hypothetical protein
VTARGAIIGLVAALFALGGSTARSQSDRSVWEGVYSESQAGRGQEVFGRICSRCHNVADFTSETFLASWEGSSALDLFTLIQKSMPQDNPGSLEPKEYLDVIAYMFRENKFPAGMGELDSEAEKLKLIRIERKK